MHDSVEEDAEQNATFGERREELITTVYVEAYELDARAAVLDNFVRVISILGVAGGVLFAAAGAAAGGTLAPIYVAIGLTAVISWLIIRALGVAYVCNLNLDAAQARLHAYLADD